MLKAVKYKLMFKFLGMSKICYIIQIIDSNSLLSSKKKKLKSDFNNSTMYWKVEIEFSINDNTKSSQI